MRWQKRDLWKAAVVGGGVLFVALMALVMVSVADAHEGTSGAATVETANVQATPTEDATMTALQKEQLSLQNKQLQQSEDRGFDAWLWNNAAAIVASFLSTLVLVIGALVGFRQWRTNRNDTLTKESDDRKEAQDKELRAQAEERFKAAVTALGSDNEATQVGGAILLRSFLNSEDKEIYGRYYAQIFDLAVAYLRLSGASQPPETSLDPLPITPLRQALIVVFKEVFPLARGRLGQIKSVLQARSLDASRIRLDDAYIVDSDLKHVFLREAFLNRTHLNRADLSEAYLRKAHLRGAPLSGANFSGADLTTTDLSGADLSRANLSEANLSEANLGGANLSGALLRQVKGLEKVKSLDHTNLQGVKGLTKEQLEACKAKGAIVDEETMASAPESPASPPPPQPSS